MDVPPNSSEDIVRSGAGTQVFRTLENVVEPGWHEWHQNWSAGQAFQEDWQANGLRFLTTVLRES